MCWVWVCQESLLHKQCCCLCLGHLCPEPLTALGAELHQAEQAETFVSCLYQICHMQHCPAALLVLFLPALAVAQQKD